MKVAPQAGHGTIFRRSRCSLTLVAAPIALPYLGFSTDLLTRVLNWGLIGVGFDILFGLTGLLSFGQAAFYGIGGFVTAYCWCPAVEQRMAGAG